MTEFKPGDVALVTCSDGKERIALCGERWIDDSRVWVFKDKSMRDVDSSTARPLVVIDPEDAEAVERLLSSLMNAWPRAVVGLPVDDKDALNRIYLDAMQAALREFADPTPPKPDEPTGLGAVVVDVEGIRWTRVEAGHAQTRNPWYPADAADFQPDEWHNLCAVEVLSEGVS